MANKHGSVYRGNRKDKGKEKRISGVDEGKREEKQRKGDFTEESGEKEVDI